MSGVTTCMGRGPDLLMFTNPSFDVLGDLPPAKVDVDEIPDVGFDTRISDEDLDEMFKSLEILELNVVPDSVGPTEDKSSTEWLAPSLEFQRIVAEGGHNASAAQNNWALCRLEKFRQYIGDDLTVEFVSMEPKRQASLLCRFFEQVTKKNGELYPTQTTMQLLDSLNRVMRRHQEARIILTGIEELPFHLKTAPLFKGVGVAVCAAMRRARDAGANKKRKKSPTVTVKTEVMILASSCMQRGHSRGLQKRVLYLISFRFGIRGGKELHKVMVADISMGKDSRGKFVRYDERLSKNYKVDMSNYQEEHFRVPIFSYDVDMVETFEEYLRHLPPGVTHLFCSCIDNPTGIQWYYNTRMGLKPLSGFTQWICEEMGLDFKEFSNKSGRTTMISRMSERGVPDSVGMLLSGHKTEGAYKRYDRTVDVKVRAAQRCCGTEDITYQDALTDEIKFMKLNEIDGVEIKEEQATEDDSAKKKMKVDSQTINEVEISSAAEGGNEKMATSSVQGEESGTASDGEKKSKSFDKNFATQPSGEDYQWIESFDWEDDLNLWKGSRNVVVNPITAMIGKLNGCTVSITVNGNVNMGNK